MPEWFFAIMVIFALIGVGCAIFGFILALEAIGDAKRKLDYLDKSDDRNSQRIHDLNRIVGLAYPDGARSIEHRLEEIEARLDDMQSDGDA